MAVIETSARKLDSRGREADVIVYSRRFDELKESVVVMPVVVEAMETVASPVQVSTQGSLVVR